GKPMEVAVVRATGACEPRCPEWIAAQGRIDTSTPGRFKNVLSGLRGKKLPVLVDSSGGFVDDAITIARMIRAAGLDVVVTKTVLSPCEPDDAACKKLAARGILLGRLEARASKCASACAMFIAGGVRRYVGAYAFVGVHELTAFSQLRKVERIYRIQRRFS